MIVFRADGSSKIGTGHIMRCLSLADALRERGREVIFLTADEVPQAMIQQHGYACAVLHTAYHHMEEELPALIPLLKRLKPECLILDSYFVTPDYMRALADMTALVYLDDLNFFDYPAQMVVNYNLYAYRTPYRQSKQYLLGPQYVPLREEFRNIGKRHDRGRVRNVLFSAGGSDPAHVTRSCVRFLREHTPIKGVTCHIVLGAMNQDIAEIEELSASLESIVLHRQVTDMRGLMLACDAAVSAAGSTLYELCACGLPTVTYVLADNQIEGAAAFESEGLMLHGGDVRTSPGFARNVFEKLKILAEDASLRIRMSQRMQDLVDGNGAARLAEALMRIKEVEA